MAEFLKGSVSFTLMTLTLCCYLFIVPAAAVDSEKAVLREGNTNAAPNLLESGSSNAALFGSRRSLRSIYGLGPKMLQISRSKIPIELDLLVENEDGDRSKRFDDYGHMRFGKRGGEEQFDDYGHMRFARVVGPAATSTPPLPGALTKAVSSVFFLPSSTARVLLL